mmetsp:Transcript_3987/g.6082  ORF Transcript_3987/g.6082 Transcript_3987/m.6082 type:complete len:94 (-) Transcript_3987:26-307(-)
MFSHRNQLLLSQFPSTWWEEVDTPQMKFEGNFKSSQSILDHFQNTGLKWLKFNVIMDVRIHDIRAQKPLNEYFTISKTMATDNHIMNKIVLSM